MMVKICTKCDVEKDLSEFPPNKQLRDGRGSHCHQCHRGYGYIAYYRDHQTELERSRIYREKNREECNSRANRWAKENHSKRCVYEQQRRARKSKSPGNGVNLSQWSELLEEYDYKCVACGNENNITMDHVVPLLFGGAHDIENIQPLCLSCNSRKKANTIDYRKRFGDELHT